MTIPNRLPKEDIQCKDVDNFFKAFFKRCAEPIEITDDEFSAYTHECFNHVLAAHYGTKGFNYVLENQDKFHDS